MSALAWIMPCSVSELVEPASSLAVTVWFRAITCPAATVMVFCPPALPRATTASPAFTDDELPTGTVASPDAPCSRIRAMSPVLS